MQRVLNQEFGFPPAELVSMEGGKTNRLWRYGDWVVKLYPTGGPDRQQAIQALELQVALAGTGLPIPAPRKTRSGALWLDLPEGLLAVLPFHPGERRRRGELSVSEAAELGRTIARLHRALAQAAPTPNQTQPSPPRPGEVLARWEYLKAQAESHQDPFDAAVIQMAGYAVRSLPGAEEPDWDLLPWQTCHRDLHLDNLLFGSDGQITAVLDFDNTGPWWPGAELMMAWNLSIPADPGEPQPSPEGAALFAAYALEAGWSGEDLTRLPLLYWYGLIANTWPAPQRYRNPEAAIPPDWLEIMAMRFRAAVWLGDHLQEMSDWFRRPHGTI